MADVPAAPWSWWINWDPGRWQGLSWQIHSGMSKRLTLDRPEGTWGKKVWSSLPQGGHHLPCALSDQLPSESVTFTDTCGQQRLRRPGVCCLICPERAELCLKKMLLKVQEAPLHGNKDPAWGFCKQLEPFFHLLRSAASPSTSKPQSSADGPCFYFEENKYAFKVLGSKLEASPSGIDKDMGLSRG